MKNILLCVSIILILGGTCSFAKKSSKLDHSFKNTQLTSLRKKVGKKSEFSIKFSNTEIRTVLKFFSAELGLNIVSSPEVIGSVTFTFNEVNPVNAFDTVLSAYGFDWYLENNIIRVFSHYPIRVFKLNYSKATLISPIIQKLISRKGTISVDFDNNALIVKAPESDLKKITSVINELDEAPQQVLVEVKILEIQAGSFKALGLDIAFSKSNGGDYAETKGLTDSSQYPAAGLFVKVINQDFESLLKMVKSKTAVDILARPKILAINHKESTLITGERLGYKVTSASSGGVLTESVQFLEVGTKLTFTPHISAKGDILMEIKPVVSEGTIKDGLPQETTTETDTSVLVRDGQTILLGGLIRDKSVETNVGVPILSSIPFIDTFFKKQEIETQKKETIVLITPYLVTPEMLKEMNNTYSHKN